MKVLWCATPTVTRASVHNGHLRGPVTLTPLCRAFSIGAGTNLFLRQACQGWDSNTQPFACGANTLTHYATVAVRNEMRQTFQSQGNIITSQSTHAGIRIPKMWVLTNRIKLTG